MIVPAYPYTSGLRVKRNRHPMMAAAVGWEYPAALAYRFTQASRPGRSDGAASVQPALCLKVCGMGFLGGGKLADARPAAILVGNLRQELVAAP